MLLAAELAIFCQNPRKTPTNILYVCMYIEIYTGAPQKQVKIDKKM